MTEEIKDKDLEKAAGGIMTPGREAIEERKRLRIVRISERQPAALSSLLAAYVCTLYLKIAPTHRER